MVAPALILFRTALPSIWLPQHLYCSGLLYQAYGCPSTYIVQDCFTKHMVAPALILFRTALPSIWLPQHLYCSGLLYQAYGCPSTYIVQDCFTKHMVAPALILFRTALPRIWLPQHLYCSGLLYQAYGCPSTGATICLVKQSWRIWRNKPEGIIGSSMFDHNKTQQIIDHVDIPWDILTHTLSYVIRGTPVIVEICHSWSMHEDITTWKCFLHYWGGGY